MPTLTLFCRYPNDDEVSEISYWFDSAGDAAAARDAVVDRVLEGGEFYLPDNAGMGPLPCQAETVFAVALRATV